MSHLRTKRILSDLKGLSPDNSPLWEHGIFTWYNSENITNVKALLIGPSDTPYYGGYFFFDINFPENYPFSPPKVKHMTTDGKIRFNPNLYADGKVCLSILGTWTGPQWTSVQTLSSVLLSIQSLLQNNPIQNEPGWEYEATTSPRAISYNKAVEHYTWNYAVHRMLQSPPHGFGMFTDMIRTHFMKSLGNHMEFITKAMTDGAYSSDVDASSPIYGMKVRFSYSEITEMLKKDVFKYNEMSIPPEVPLFDDVTLPYSDMFLNKDTKKGKDAKISDADADADSDDMQDVLVEKNIIEVDQKPKPSKYGVGDLIRISGTKEVYEVYLNAAGRRNFRRV